MPIVVTAVYLHTSGSEVGVSILPHITVQCIAGGHRGRPLTHFIQ